jgi:hypothetical protein
MRLAVGYPCAVREVEWGFPSLTRSRCEFRIYFYLSVVGITS